MYDQLNALPSVVLNALDSSSAILFCSNDTNGEVLVTPTLKVRDLQSLPDARLLEDIRRDKGVHSLTLTLLALNPDYINRAASNFENSEAIIEELNSLLRQTNHVYVAYTVTHYDAGPLEEFTVSVGGDCYRNDQASLAATLDRTKDLASAMIRKAVMVFPDIPALHGGKKGEWIIIDDQGMKIGGISELSVIALGSLVIPLGIDFLNSYKEFLAQTKRGITTFPTLNYIRPDSASPDVMSGKYWRSLCNVWSSRNVGLSQVTCLPDFLGGPIHPSSRPTGYGIATTAVRLAERLPFNRDVRELTFLIEALGGVSSYAIEALIERFEVPPDNIHAFDPDPSACDRILSRFNICSAISLSNEEYYSSKLSGHHFDVWINNGLGDNTTSSQIDLLLKSGVRLFCGAANNILQLESRSVSLEHIFESNSWIWPDEAASAGGWTLAVIDMFRRAKGEKSNDDATGQHVLNTIVSRNENLVIAVFDAFQGRFPTGRELWRQVNDLIDNRVKESNALELSTEQILLAADITNWNI